MASLRHPTHENLAHVEAGRIRLAKGASKFEGLGAGKGTWHKTS